MTQFILIVYLYATDNHSRLIYMDTSVTDSRTDCQTQATKWIMEQYKMGTGYPITECKSLEGKGK